MPLGADGRPVKASERVREFVAALGRFGLPVETVDERHTSVEAEVMLKNERAMGIRGRIKKEMIDSAAAVLIAERWLERKN